MLLQDNLYENVTPHCAPLAFFALLREPSLAKSRRGSFHAVTSDTLRRIRNGKGSTLVHHLPLFLIARAPTAQQAFHTFKPFSFLYLPLYSAMPVRRSTRARTALTFDPSPPFPPVSSRPRRAVSGSTMKVTRDESFSPDESKKALKLTVKMPASKLREATSNPRSRPSSRGNAVAKLADSLTGGEIVSGPRASRANKKYVVESESSQDDSEDEDEDEIQVSDEEQDDEDEVEEDEEEQIGGPEESDEEDAAEEEDEEDAEGDFDADGDVDMDDAADIGQALPPQQPILKVNGPAAPSKPKAASKPTVTVTPAKADKVKSVEAKEMEMDDDDEELSELSEDDEDAEGDLDDEIGDDDDSRSPGSRGSTPDVSKMTKRQRSRLDQVMGVNFLQLPMGTFCWMPCGKTEWTD